MARYIQDVVVFCGSSLGNDEGIVGQARRLGELIGQNQYNLIYGGGTTGLMGIVSEAALKAGAAVKGIIPKIFHAAGAKEQGSLDGSNDLIVDTMAARKQQMLDDSQAGIILPGAYGSLDEIYEMATAQQLKTYLEPESIVQPIIVINYEGYYDGQIASLDKMVEKGFLTPEFRKFITFVRDADEAVEALNEFNRYGPRQAKQFQSPPAPKP